MRPVLPLILCCLLAPLVGRTQSDSMPPVIPIGLVQGQPEEGLDPATFASPYDGKMVTVEGVVHGLLIRYGRRGNAEYGFFIQNRPKTGDGNPETSDGLFVFTQGERRTQTAANEVYVPRVGDEIRVSGKIREIMGTTHLTAVQVQQVLNRDLDPDQELPVTTVVLDGDPAMARAYWERHEGMRMRLPAGCVVQEGRHTFGEDRDAEFRVILPDSIPARRTETYHRRVFRDPHPLDDIGESGFDNGNAYRILLGSLGIKGATHNAKALLEPVRTFDTLTAPVTGAVYQRFEDYSLQPDQQPPIEVGANPSLNGRCKPLDPQTHFTIATMNLENLYDHRNDPDDNCDDAGDPGNPHVYKPFNYLPANQEAYQARLDELAIQIVRGIGGPDLLLIQEIEDQDMLKAEAAGLVRADNNADGKPDVLQELIQAIRRIGGPAYEPACDRDAADYRGITTAFLYQPERVELVKTGADHPVLGSSLSLDYRGLADPCNRHASNPKAINARMPLDVDVSDGMSGDKVFSRAPQIAQFRVRADDTVLYVVDNHLSSRPDQRIGQRMEQAALNAAVVKAIFAQDPGAAIVLGGDLNTFPRPDDPTPDTPRDQLGALYRSGLKNLYDDLLAANPAGAYTYVYQGQAQTLDQLFVSPTMHQRLAQVWVAHLNSDFPADWTADSPYGASDHEPVVATFRLGPRQE